MILDGLRSRRKQCEKAIDNLVAALETGAASPTIAARIRKREDELENINLAIAEQELVQKKFDENRSSTTSPILQKVTGRTSDMRKAWSLPSSIRCMSTKIRS